MASFTRPLMHTDRAPPLWRKLISPFRLDYAENALPHSQHANSSFHCPLSRFDLCED